MTDECVSDVRTRMCVMHLINRWQYQAETAVTESPDTNFNAETLLVKNECFWLTTQTGGAASTTTTAARGSE